jgi:hypothetical protein
MLPVGLSVTGPAGRDRHYRFQVARSRFVTPGLVAATVVNAVSEALYDLGASTNRFEITYYLDGGRRVLRRGNAWLAPTPLSGPGEEVNTTLNALMSNRFEAVRVDSVRASVAVTDTPDDAAIAGVRVVPAVAAPGDSVRVEVTLRPSRHGQIRRWVSLRVPESTPPGTLNVRVCDARQTEGWERDRAPDRYEARSLDQLLRLLGSERRSDRVYVQLHRASPGATIRGGEVSQAPASVLGVLGTGGTAGEAGLTKGATLAEVSIPLDRVVTGCESTTLEVLPYRAR